MNQPISQSISETEQWVVGISALKQSAKECDCDKLCAKWTE